MSKWKRLVMMTISTSILLTQGGPLPYLAYAAKAVKQAQINGDINFSWTTADQVIVGTSFNPYEGLHAIDADGDDVAVLVQVAGEVDTSCVGTYSITYSIKNVDDKIFTIERQVEVIPLEKSEVVTETETESEESQEDNTDVSNTLEVEESSLLEVDPNSLDDISLTLIHREDDNTLISFSLNTETKKYEVHLAEDLKEKLKNIGQQLFTLKVVATDRTEKLSLIATVNDLMTDGDFVKKVNELTYEIGDEIQLIPFNLQQTTVLINGIVDSDSLTNQEDYSDGVNDEDLICNVRFVIGEQGLNTLYNEAPLINGAEDVEVESLEFFDPLTGVTVIDDHDGDLTKNLIIEQETLGDTKKQITYLVTDSWGRTTEVVRHVTQKELIEQSNSELNQQSTQEREPQAKTSTTLANNSIEVHGIAYEIGDAAKTLRIKFIFNENRRRIYVTEGLDDVLRFNSKVGDVDYFKIIQYTAAGKVRNELVLTGNDRTNSSKLIELRQLGWRYEYGDRIELWHYQSDTKLLIKGNVQNANYNFEQGVPNSILSSTRFELTKAGLEMITNEPPTIEFSTGNHIQVLRGSVVNLYDGIDIINSDNEGGNIQIETNPKTLDTSELGTYSVTYTVTDDWGLSSKKIRTYEVLPKNEIDKIRIDISLATHTLRVTFDEVLHQLRAEKVESVEESNPLSKNLANIVLRLYMADGKIRRTFTISPNDDIDDIITSINGYAYQIGDYVSITSVTPEYIRIYGNIIDKPNDLDYTSGNIDMNYFQNVRFYLKPETYTFNYVYNEAPEILGDDEISINRGERFSFTDGLTLKDDHDGEFKLTDDIVKIEILSGDINVVGDVLYKVTYTDSWGRSSSIERRLTVKPSKELELAKIQLMDHDETMILEVGFDGLTNKLKVISYAENKWIQGNKTDIAFILKCYNAEKQLKNTITLNYQEVITHSLINQIELIDYKAGDYLTLEVYDTSKIKVINTKNEVIMFEDEDKMVHSRLELNDDKIEIIYNQAPTFEGIDDVKVVYGTSFDENEDVSVIDEDKNLTFNVIGKVDTNKLETFKLQYQTTDSYGRTTTKERNVTVVPVYTTNEVEYYEGNQLKFAIGINESATGFTYRLGTAMDEPISDNQENVGGVKPQEPSTDEVDKTKPLFQFVVYNQNGNKVTELVVNDTTEINDALFQTLKSTIVRPGYYFSVNARDLTKLKVTGSLVKNSILDNDNNQDSEMNPPIEDDVQNPTEPPSEEVTPPIQGEENSGEPEPSRERQSNHPLESVNYQDLTEANRDQVDNVRFKLTENIVEVFYNQKPTITINPTETPNLDSILLPTENGHREPSSEEEATQQTYEFETTTEPSTNEERRIALIRDKALTKENYNLLDDVMAMDPEDGELTLSVKNISLAKGMVPSGEYNLDESVQALHKWYTVTYSVKDSWGRESEPVTRKVYLKSAIDDVSITMNSHTAMFEDNPVSAINIDFSFTDNGNNWNAVTKLQTNQNVEKEPSTEAPPYPAFAMIVSNKNNAGEYQQQFNYLFGGRQGTIIPDSAENGPYRNVANTQSEVYAALGPTETSLISTNERGPLNSIPLQYGTMIQLRSWKEGYLFINGTVVNEQEDYSKGATIDEYLMNSHFIVSPEGLRQIYTPTSFNDNYHRITWYNGINGLKEFSLVFNPATKTIDWEQDTNQLYDLNATNEIAFSITFYKTDGESKTYNASGGNSIYQNGPQRPNHFKNWLKTEFSTWLGVEIQSGNDFTPISYENIAYVTVSTRDVRIRNLRIEGDISYIGMNSQDNDYSQGAKNQNYFENVRFYLNKTENSMINNSDDSSQSVLINPGLVAVYNEAPVFTGVDGANSIIGNTFDPKAGVSVTDKTGGQFEIIDEFTVIGNENITTHTVSQHEITYQATDSWGRSTEIEREVNIRPKVYENKFQIFSISDLVNPAFEIIIVNDETPSTTKTSDSLSLGHYQLNRLTDEMLNSSCPTNEVFKIWIYNKDNQKKAYVSLLGRDTSSSEKLNVLENIEYEPGDYIKVWRAPEPTATDGVVSTLKIAGTILGENDQEYTTGIFNVEYMNNTVFQVPTTNTDNLKAFYNQAPVISAKDKTIYFGDEFNPLDDVSASDDKTTDITLTESNVTSNVNTNRIGEYEVTYTVTDNWGRTSSKTITVKVISKVTRNMFVIGIGNNDSQPSVVIGFNEEANRLVINPNSPSIKNMGADDSQKPTETPYFRFIIYNRLGVVKSQLNLSQEELNDSNNFSDLTNIEVENDDMISVVIQQNHDSVSIQGDVITSNQSSSKNLSTTTEYQQGFTSTNQMEQVRFKITNNGLEEVKALNNNDSSVTIEFTDEILTTRRSIEPDFFKGMLVNHPNELITNDKVKITEYDLSVMGNQTITYTVTDSWGNTFTKTRTLVVQPYNDLETVTFTVKDKVGAKRLEIGFDGIERHLTANTTLFSTFMEYIPFTLFPSDKAVVKITVFLQDGEEKTAVEIVADDFNDTDALIQKIKAITFDYTDYIGIEVYDYEKDQYNETNGIEISGNVTPCIPEDDETVDSEQGTPGTQERYIAGTMDAIRYHISEDGLEVKYNHAPHIEVDSDFQFIGQEEKIESHLIVYDKEDGNNYSLKIDKGNFSINDIGTYEITATVKDNWNRTTTYQFNYYVKSYLDEVEMNFLQYGTNDEILKITFDSITQKIKFKFNEDSNASFNLPENNGTPDIEVDDNNILDNGSSSTDEEPSGNGTVQPLENVLFKINILDENGKLVVPITIQSTDTVRTLKEKFSDYLDGYKYNYGYFINIDVVDNRALDIIRAINVNTSLLSDELDIDYSQKLESNDYFNNVRFELAAYGLMQHYNQAPTLSFMDGFDESITKIKNSDVSVYELLQGILIDDDHDVLREEEVEILYNGSNDPESLRLGENKITYYVTDSWGRQSNTLTRELKLMTAMNDIEIKMYHIDASEETKDDNKNVLNIKFVFTDPGASEEETPNSSATQTTAGDDENQPNSTVGKLYAQNNSNINNFMATDFPAYAIIITDKDGTTEKYKQFFGGVGNIEGQFDSLVQEYGNPTNNVNEAISELNKIPSVSYGDRIYLRSFQVGHLVIDGNVINAQENYAEGAYLDDTLQKSYFELTDSGLKQVYTNTTTVDEGNNKIVLLSGSAGAAILELNLTAPTRTYMFNSDSPTDTFGSISGNIILNQRINATLNNIGDNAFTITHHSSTGKSITETTCPNVTGAEQYTQTRGDGNSTCTFIAKNGGLGATAERIKEVLSLWKLSVGDYLRIQIDEPKLKNNIRLYGDIKKIGSSIQDIDYQEPISDISYYNEAYFYFNGNGLTVFYNSAPEFSGLTDIVKLNQKQGEDNETGMSENQTPSITIDLLDDVYLSDEQITYGATTIDNNDGTAPKWALGDQDADWTTSGLTWEIYRNSVENNNKIIDNTYENLTTATTYEVQGLGIHRFIYVATDSLGRKTMETRFVWFQQESELTISDESKLIVQQSDPNLQTEEARKAYLEDLVTITDFEDQQQLKPGEKLQFKEGEIEGTFNVNNPGVYTIDYKYQDTDGNISRLDGVEITVVRSISVSVPRNNIPFQVVTNLLYENENEIDKEEGIEFISGNIKVLNNYVTDVNMSIKSITVSENQSNGYGTFTLVEPEEVNWDELTRENAMTKMALGLYVRDLVTLLTDEKIESTNAYPTKDYPIWLKEDMPSTPIGTLPGVDVMQYGISSNVITLSFTAKYGKNFISGKHRMKFTMIIQFD